MKKLFIIRKYVWAQDAKEAIKIEKIQTPDDVWIDEEWKKTQFDTNTPHKIGFYKRD